MWYFFARNTQHRATPTGYWSPIGDDETIMNGDQDIGIKRTLVFYFGEIKTSWTMHEYHLSSTIAGTTTTTSSSTRRSSSRRGRNPKTVSLFTIPRNVFVSITSSTKRLPYDH